MKFSMIKKFVVVALVLTTTMGAFSSFTSAPAQGEEDLEEQLAELENQIDGLNEEKSDIQSKIDANQYVIANFDAQLSKLYGEIQIFQKDIDKLNLEIEELDISIRLLERKIEEAKQDIIDSEQNIADLEVESLSRINDSYVSFKITGGGEVGQNNILNTESINQYFRDSQYISIIQEDTNDMLTELTDLKIELENKRRELNEKLAQQEKERAEIDVKKDELAKRKTELDVKIVAYQAEAAKKQAENNELGQTVAAFSQQEAQLKAEYDQVLNQLFSSFTPTTSGEYVTAGKIIGQQGCTGLCTGPHLHFIVWANGSYQNPCNYISACGGNQLEMPIRNGYTITSWYGNRCFWWNGSNYCDFHNGLDMAASPWNAPVYAAHDGYSYKGTDSHGANYVVICENLNCNNGIKTGYWHLSSF